MSDETGGALDRLQAKLQQQLDQVRKTKSAINALCEAFDKPPLYTDIDQDSAVKTTIARGQFYGQPLATCVRTILEMRRTANLGAASVNEIFQVLKEGGYAFEAKDDENAKSGLRQSLRKNPVFHRIPSGEWGMLAWYPNAKVEKDSGDEENNGAGATEKEKKAKPEKHPAKAVAPKPNESEEPEPENEKTASTN